MSGAGIYAVDDDPAPDADFAAASLRHLVAGNRGRLLDARRTPVTVVEVAGDRGSFVVRVEAFEDRGARWELGFEELPRFQFARGGRSLAGAPLAELRRSAARFDRDLTIECSGTAREQTLRELSRRRSEARAWLADAYGPLAGRVDLAARVAARRGDPEYFALLDAFIGERGLDALERAFTAAFVSNPRAGEVVKGHAIVLAELGLCHYDGKAPRDPELFAGGRSRDRRAEHLLWRLAFTQELFAALGAPTVTLYRAVASDGPFVPRSPGAFVSATFSRDVADAHFAGGPTTTAAALWRQTLATDRLLLSFVETRALNERFHEAEAILLGDLGEHAF